MTHAALEITNFRLGPETNPRLGPLSLTLQAGEALALLGPNGAGKSSLLRTIIGLETPNAGTITLNGAPMQLGDPIAMAKSGIGYVPEGRRVFPGLTAAENLLAVSDASRGERRARMAEILALFPALEARLQSEAWRLSGGEQQMLAIGRALMRRPNILLLDEPSLGLAPQTAATLYAALADVRLGGVAILLAEQNVADAAALADRAAILISGKLVAEGPADTVATPESLAAAYLR